MFEVGNHKGETVEQVYAYDQEYLQWFYDEFRKCKREDYISKICQRIKEVFEKGRNDARHIK